MIIEWTVSLESLPAQSPSVTASRVVLLQRIRPLASGPARDHRDYLSASRRSESNLTAGEAGAREVPAGQAARRGIPAVRAAVAAPARSCPGPRRQQAQRSWAHREMKRRALWSAYRAEAGSPVLAAAADRRPRAAGIQRQGPCSLAVAAPATGRHRDRRLVEAAETAGAERRRRALAAARRH